MMIAVLIDKRGMSIASYSYTQKDTAYHQCLLECSNGRQHMTMPNSYNSLGRSPLRAVLSS